MRPRAPAAWPTGSIPSVAASSPTISPQFAAPTWSKDPADADDETPVTAVAASVSIPTNIHLSRLGPVVQTWGIQVPLASDLLNHILVSRALVQRVESVDTGPESRPRSPRTTPPDATSLHPTTSR
jgi:hypothetical protein